MACFELKSQYNNELNCDDDRLPREKSEVQASYPPFSLSIKHGHDFLLLQTTGNNDAILNVYRYSIKI